MAFTFWACTRRSQSRGGFQRRGRWIRTARDGGEWRVREAVSGPDGAVYVVLNRPDVILRLTPSGAR